MIRDQWRGVAEFLEALLATAECGEWRLDFDRQSRPTFRWPRP